MSYRDGTRAGAVAAAVALAVGAAPVGAADWEMNPTLELGYLYDSNYRLTPPDLEDEVNGGVLDAQIELRASGPLTTFALIPRIRASYFPDDREDDSDDYFARMDWAYRTQVMRALVRADYSQESVINSEQPSSDIDSGLGQTGGADGGFVVFQNRRDLARLQPSLSYEFSQRHRLEVGADALDVTFERQIPGAQTDYRNYGVNAGFAFTHSPRSAVTVRALAARYDIEIEGNSADAYGLEVEWSTNATETIRAFVRGGAQQTMFEDNQLTGTPGEDVATWLAGAGLQRSVKLTEFFLDATHSVSPNSSGLVMQRDQLRFRLTHLFTPRVSMFTGVRAIRDDPIASDSLRPTRNYATGDLGFEWRVLQQLSLVTSINYTWQEFDQDGSPGSESGSAMLSFVYEPRRRD